MSATKHQNESLEWFNYCPITASNAKKVYTLYQVLLKKPDSYVKSVISPIMHYDNLNLTVALKHGLAMEIYAKQKYQ